MCCGQVVEAQAELSSLESRFVHNTKQAALSEEAVDLLTDELQAALDGLRSREERNLHRKEELEDLHIRMNHEQKQVGVSCL